MAQYRSAACACLALVPFAGVAGWESLEKVVTPGGWDFEHGRVPAQSGAAEALAVAFENLACRQNTACAGGEVKMLTLKGLKTGLFASMFQAMARRFSCSLHATPRAAYDIALVAMAPPRVAGDTVLPRGPPRRDAARPADCDWRTLQVVHGQRGVRGTSQFPPVGLPVYAPGGTVGPMCRA